MNEAGNPLAWLAYAEEDYTAAKSALRHKRPLILTACFHAQQCAEKCLKALLVASDVDFPKTHDLSALNTLCTQAGIITGLSASALAKLSEHAVHTRSPGEVPTLEEAKEAIQIANTVRRFTKTWLGIH